MKARELKVEILTAAASADLETAVNVWLGGAGEKEIVLPVQVQKDGDVYLATITYSEG